MGRTGRRGFSMANEQHRRKTPEDAGGPPGFMEVMEALKDQSHPRHREIRDWVGATYDPDKFDVWAVDHALTLAVAWGAV